MIKYYQCEKFKGQCQILKFYKADKSLSAVFIYLVINMSYLLQTLFLLHCPSKYICIKQQLYMIKYSAGQDPGKILYLQLT